MCLNGRLWLDFNPKMELDKQQRSFKVENIFGLRDSSTKSSDCSLKASTLNRLWVLVPLELSIRPSLSLQLRMLDIILRSRLNGSGRTVLFYQNSKVRHVHCLWWSLLKSRGTATYVPITVSEASGLTGDIAQSEVFIRNNVQYRILLGLPF
ncbi:hypothetical protein V2J09_006532 [Rumex salicifolius]